MMNTPLEKLKQPPPVTIVQRQPGSWAWWSIYGGFTPIRVIQSAVFAGIDGYEIERYWPSKEDRAFSRCPLTLRTAFASEAELVNMKSAVTHMQCRLTDMAREEEEARERCSQEIARLRLESEQTVEHIHFIQGKRRDRPRRSRRTLSCTGC